MRAKMKFNDLTKAQRQQHVANLEATPNMYEFLIYLNEHFNMLNNQPGFITKRILSDKMINAVLPMINPEIINLNES